MRKQPVHCKRCQHDWTPMEKTKGKPKKCAACCSPYWDRDRVRKEYRKLDATEYRSIVRMRDKQGMTFAAIASSLGGNATSEGARKAYKRMTEVQNNG